MPTWSHSFSLRAGRGQQVTPPWLQQGQAWLQGGRTGSSSPAEISASGAESTGGWKALGQGIQVTGSLVLLTMLWLK